MKKNRKSLVCVQVFFLIKFSVIIQKKNGEGKQKSAKKTARIDSKVEI